MRQEIQEVIDGHLTISELIEKVTKNEEDPLARANIINELWSELNAINAQFAKNSEDKKSA
ncbi:MAG: hypothetical protein OIF32_06275 [Campylobacterales bacterium]|nr:hypothetical protein [Campylobacterales bacterium]